MAGRLQCRALRSYGIGHIVRYRFLELFDSMIVVSAPEELRLARVMKRDNIPHWAVRARMQHQKPESEIIPHPNLSSLNDNQSLVIPQALKIHEMLNLF